MTTAIEAPYWLDFLATQDHAVCAVCYKEGRGWVRVGPPIPHRIGTGSSALRNQQRAAMIDHVQAFHPDLPVRWSK